MSIAISGSTITFADLTTQTTALVSGAGFKNRIYNGDMRIWQRGTSFSAAVYSYSSDRWAFGIYANTTVSQSASAPTGFQYSLKVQRPAAATSLSAILAMQTIESANCLDLAGQSVTLSFYAKAGANYSATGGVLGVEVFTGTVADQGGGSYAAWTGAAQPITSSVVLTSTFQRFTLTGTFAANILEVAALFFYTPVGTAGADDSFHITGVQLERGSTATEFERRPIGTEIMLCRRYFITLPMGLAKSPNAWVGGSGPMNSQPYGTMRVQPSLSYTLSIGSGGTYGIIGNQTGCVYQELANSVAGTAVISANSEL